MSSLPEYRAALANAESSLRNAAKEAIDLDRPSDVRALLYVLETMKQVKVPDLSPKAPTRRPDELNEHEKGLVEGKRIIEAIKEHRNRTGLGLKNSKDVVVAYRNTLETK